MTEIATIIVVIIWVMGTVASPWGVILGVGSFFFRCPKGGSYSKEELFEGGELMEVIRYFVFE